MDKKDLIFLSAAHATSDNFKGLIDYESAKEYFLHWHMIFSDLYDKLSNPTEPSSDDIKSINDIVGLNKGDSRFTS